MSNYITLLGAEEVSRAASMMREAAHEITRAMSALEQEHRRHEEAMREIISEMNPYKDMTA